MDSIAEHDPIAEHDRGYRLHLHNRMTEAEPFYHKALALDPDFKEAWMNLGLLAMAQGRPEQALSELALFSSHTTSTWHPARTSRTLEPSPAKSAPHREACRASKPWVCSQTAGRRSA